MTGLPPTLSIGLGIRCVCGRRRVPLPASGMITFIAWSSWAYPSWRARAFAPVLVLEAHDVVEVRRGRLEHVAVGDRDHLVDRVRRDAERLAGLEPLVDQLARAVHAALQLHAVGELTGEEVH